jgi:ATP-binding cassette subfamily B (MDR/TAP) protein 1
MHTGERQAAKMRQAYLRAMLDQDIAVFDTEASTGEVINAITSDILVVQDAISEKVRTSVRPRDPVTVPCLAYLLRVAILAVARRAADRRGQQLRRGGRGKGREELTPGRLAGALI